MRIMIIQGEKKYIFHDKSKDGFKDDPNLAKLATYEHVILSSHIAFYTDQVHNYTLCDIYYQRAMTQNEVTCDSFTMWDSNLLDLRL